jgi:hypothetical protein
MYRRIIIGIIVVLLIMTCAMLSTSRDLSAERKEYLTQLNDKVTYFYPEKFKVKFIMLRNGMTGYNDILQVTSNLEEENDEADELIEYFMTTEGKNLNRYGILIVMFTFLDGQEQMFVKSRQI